MCHLLDTKQLLIRKWCSTFMNLSAAELKCSFSAEDDHFLAVTAQLTEMDDDTAGSSMVRSALETHHGWESRLMRGKKVSEGYRTSRQK